MEDLKLRALQLLREGLGNNCDFREGQWEAIKDAITPGSRTLIVQRTGWGKSFVYFVAAKMVREKGSGPVLLVSPLLSLVRNQIAFAKRIGLCAATINSTNREDWMLVSDELKANKIDVLLISPERLGNDRFRENILPRIESETALVVIDEAHCISDWGHDFRPDYRRILPIISRLNPTTSVLATTATANNRVIEDLIRQLGTELIVSRGKLMRESLILSVFNLPDQSERLAWLAKYVPRLEGTGIIYTLTINDARRVAEWLQQNGIDAKAYHADLMNETREQLESEFQNNKIKVLVATVALGMGYDKPDVAFVIHFQIPGSVISYYQQVGRAGRSLDAAHGILLHGSEDSEIINYFIDSAFPTSDQFDAVLQALIGGATSLNGVLTRTNIRFKKAEQAILLMDVEGVISGTRQPIQVLQPKWRFDSTVSARISEQRKWEASQMLAYSEHKGCRMEFLAKSLDDPAAAQCGKCDWCKPHGNAPVPHDLIIRALSFLKQDKQIIEPRKILPSGTSVSGKIKEEELALEGCALCVYNDSGWGKTVREGKYETGRFADELVNASANLIQTFEVPPEWVCFVPTNTASVLVKDFAQRLANALGIPFENAVTKTIGNRPQKELENSAAQFENVWHAFEVNSTRPGVCLLVDDVVDSGWTLTVIGLRLRQAGSGKVIPFALASAKPRK